ncbi:MAG: hypothetical protein HY822_00150 [Acidobacteria bacterium]|nr:hypothetical protein [Acidobacteriota bacterium]
MKKSKNPKTPAAARWLPWALAAAAALAALAAYEPALGGDFVFDDRYLPFLNPGLVNAPLSAWLSHTRPILTASFWLHLRALGSEPFTCHLVNLLLHLLNSYLVFRILRRFVLRAELAAFGAAVFLLHPLQTESVSYVASRSEALSAAFLLGSLAVFVWRRAEAVTWRRSGAVLALFGGAVLTKEHTAVLPALFLLIDYYWGAIRGNWRFYVPLAAACAAGLAFVASVLRASNTAGFAVKNLAWHEYFFTQCRVIWTYLRLYVLPSGQNLDPDVPISRGPLDHGAIAGLAGLAALAAAAWWWRKREPMFFLGILVFLVLLAPTSSFVPIRDPLAERRMYLPMLGLILATVALLRRWSASGAARNGALGLVLVVLSALTYQRNLVWAGSIPLWEDTAAKSPAKARPRFQLAFAYYEAGRCADAVREFEATARLQPPDYELLVDWALALDCNNQSGEALDRLQRAAQLEPSAHAYALLGMIHGKRGEREAALAALERAESIRPDFDMLYAYRGNLFLMSQEYERAAGEFRRALALNPSNPAALQGLRMAGRR